MGVPTSPDYDVLVVGGGLSGIYSLYRMLKLGLKCLVLEEGSGEGGTWFWNRYPGCRLDSESWSYGFKFSQELLDEWDWSENFVGQPELLRYAQFVTDKFDLRQHMQFNTLISSAHWQEGTNSWLLTDSEGRTYHSRFLITAMGILSKPTLPNIPGIHDFKGLSFHSTRWPNSPNLQNKRIGIIGTGATGIQIIQEITKTNIKSLTVFQRTPNWTGPLRNKPILPEEMQAIRRRYPEIYERCAASYSGFVHMSNPKKTLEVDAAERQRYWEQIYATPGFEKWQSNYSDIGYDRKANALVSEFFANKVRERVKDPKTAELLIPKNHGFGTRRVPLETHYYEAYNRPNVRLVDIANDTPIERITESGVLLDSGEEIPLDILIHATGFDAGTGSFAAVDIRGVGGIKLNKEAWSDGPRTFLGFFVHRFPNMMMVMGPHQMFGNIPRSIEYAVDWIADFIGFCRENGITYAEARPEMVQKWTQHVFDCAQGLLANEIDSWMTGVNTNVKGKEKRIIARYGGPAPGFRARAGAVACAKYTDLVLA